MANSYTTRSGDTWDQIAARALNNELLMHLMLDANPTYNYVARFEDGVVLNVPELPEAGLSESLPPWRRP